MAVYLQLPCLHSSADVSGQSEVAIHKSQLLRRHEQYWQRLSSRRCIGLLQVFEAGIEADSKNQPGAATVLDQHHKIYSEEPCAFQGAVSYLRHMQTCQTAGAHAK